GLDGTADFPASPFRPAPAPVSACFQLCRRAGAGAIGAGGNAAGRGVRPDPPQANESMTQPPDDLVRAVEATLFAAEAPMTAEEISAHLEGADVRGALAELQATY